MPTVNPDNRSRPETSNSSASPSGFILVRRDEQSFRIEDRDLEISLRDTSVGLRRINTATDLARFRPHNLITNLLTNQTISRTEKIGLCMLSAGASVAGASTVLISLASVLNQPSQIIDTLVAIFIISGCVAGAGIGTALIGRSDSRNR